MVKLVKIFAIMISRNFLYKPLCKWLSILSRTFIFALFPVWSFLTWWIFLNDNSFRFSRFSFWLFFVCFSLVLLINEIFDFDLMFSWIKNHHVKVSLLNFYSVSNILNFNFWHDLWLQSGKLFIIDLICFNFNIIRAILYQHSLFLSFNNQFYLWYKSSSLVYYIAQNFITVPLVQNDHFRKIK